VNCFTLLGKYPAFCHIARFCASAEDSFPSDTWLLFEEPREINAAELVKEGTVDPHRGHHSGDLRDCDLRFLCASNDLGPLQRRSATDRLTRDEARRAPANFAKVPELPGAATTAIANRMQRQSAYLFSTPRGTAAEFDRFQSLA
jgi:hypothetical protein